MGLSGPWARTLYRQRCLAVRIRISGRMERSLAIPTEAPLTRGAWSHGLLLVTTGLAWTGIDDH